MSIAFTQNEFALDLTRQELARQAEQQAFELEGLEALRHYRATGLHITGEEFGAYIESLQRGEKVELPKCHN